MLVLHLHQLHLLYLLQQLKLKSLTILLLRFRYYLHIFSLYRFSYLYHPKLQLYLKLYFLQYFVSIELIVQELLRLLSILVHLNFFLIQFELLIHIPLFFYLLIHIKLFHFVLNFHMIQLMHIMLSLIQFSIYSSFFPPFIYFSSFVIFKLSILFIILYFH